MESTREGPGHEGGTKLKGEAMLEQMEERRLRSRCERNYIGEKKRSKRETKQQKAK